MMKNSNKDSKRSVKKSFKKRLVKIAASFLIVISAVIVGFYIYTLDYYRASEEVLQITENTSLEVVLDDNITTIYPEDSKKTSTGLIFYPGGKVEASAYLPLLIQLAEEGITCILIEMPMNLAVFDVNAADDIFDDYPEIQQWYIAGHSLGGAMASSYMKDNYDKVSGMILLGAYPVNDAPVETLVLYGTYDVMLDLEKVGLADKVVEIKDGNHANFGNYGTQKGDGVALITREEQQKIAVDAILAFIDSTQPQ